MIDKEEEVSSSGSSALSRADALETTTTFYGM